MACNRLSRPIFESKLGLILQYTLTKTTYLATFPAGAILKVVVSRLVGLRWVKRVGFRVSGFGLKSESQLQCRWFFWKRHIRCFIAVHRGVHSFWVQFWHLPCQILIKVCHHCVVMQENISELSGVRTPLMHGNPLVLYVLSHNEVFLIWSDMNWSSVHTSGNYD